MTEIQMPERSHQESAKLRSPPSDRKATRADDGLDRLLTTDEVAERLRVAPATLVWWRSQKQGPAWVRLGHGRRAPIRYRPGALEAYIAQMEGCVF